MRRTTRDPGSQGWLGAVIGLISWDPLAPGDPVLTAPGFPGPWLLMARRG